MNKLWFKAKCYGWGWYPCTWQGWVIILVYLLVLLGISSFFESKPDGSVGLYVLSVSVITAILIYICFRTGERPSWRWGKKKE